MISIVVIYSENDKSYMTGLRKTYPKNVQIVEFLTKKADKDSVQLNINVPNIVKGVICYEEWHFARIRNLAKSYANGDWIISIDADERFSVGENEELIQTIENLTADIGALTWNNCISVNESGQNIYTVKQQCRIFRKELDWFGAVHENVEMDCEKQGLIIAQSNYLIVHLGYSTQEIIKAKTRRNIDLFYKNIELLKIEKYRELLERDILINNKVIK